MRNLNPFLYLLRGEVKMKMKFQIFFLHSYKKSENTGDRVTSSKLGSMKYN